MRRLKKMGVNTNTTDKRYMAKIILRIFDNEKKTAINYDGEVCDNIITAYGVSNDMKGAIFKAQEDLQITMNNDT